MVRPTDFCPLRPASPNVRQQFHELYEELIADEERNQLICHDLIQTLRGLVVLRGGMRKKELDAISARLAAIPADEARVILATGRYVGEGFDDARLDTLFLTLPVSWHGTIAQ
jgi:hypothetical protein